MASEGVGRRTGGTASNRREPGRARPAAEGPVRRQGGDTAWGPRSGVSGRTGGSSLQGPGRQRPVWGSGPAAVGGGRPTGLTGCTVAARSDFAATPWQPNDTPQSGIRSCVPSTPGAEAPEPVRTAEGAPPGPERGPAPSRMPEALRAWSSESPAGGSREQQGSTARPPLPALRPPAWLLTIRASVPLAIRWEY